MKRMHVAVIGAALAALAGCVTTEQAQKAMDSRFIGQPSDVFFSQYGAPQSSFALNNGGTTYRWRGGETVIMIPAVYRTVDKPASGIGANNTKTTTTTTVSRPDTNTTVIETNSSSFNVNLSASPQQVLVSPARTEPVFCEAQIAVDAKGIITGIRVTQDTQGAGLSISRCAEVFDVKS